MLEITINNLLWDGWNVAHIARHDALPSEVEELCQGRYIVRQGKRGRLLVIGLTDRERMLTAALDPQENKAGAYYVVTARPSSKKERQLYRDEQNKGGEQAA